jgi:sterol desaturase/sphingolipid hydroxylase (fatty acid hydroxylase superfamily)
MLDWLQARSLPELIGASFAFFTALTALSLVSGYGIEAALHKKGRKVFDVKHKPHQLRREVTGNVLWILLWCPLVAVVLERGWIRFAPWTSWRESLPRELLTGFLCMGVFQGYYWCMHRAMHWRPLFFMHRWHHQSLVTTAMTGFSMHPLEGVGWAVGFLAPAALASQLTPVGLYGFAFFLVFDWYGNIVGHINAEMKPPFSTTKWGSRLLNNPVSYHCLHHARFNGHYGFATAWADAIFHTQFDDWLEVAERVSSGEPMTEIWEHAELLGEA